MNTPETNQVIASNEIVDALQRASNRLWDLMNMPGTNEWLGNVSLAVQDVDAVLGMITQPQKETYKLTVQDLNIFHNILRGSCEIIHDGSSEARDFSEECDPALHRHKPVFDDGETGD